MSKFTVFFIFFFSINAIFGAVLQCSKEKIVKCSHFLPVKMKLHKSDSFDRSVLNQSKNLSTVKKPDENVRKYLVGKRSNPIKDIDNKYLQCRHDLSQSTQDDQSFKNKTINLELSSKWKAVNNSFVLSKPGKQQQIQKSLSTGFRYVHPMMWKFSSKKSITTKAPISAAISYSSIPLVVLTVVMLKLNFQFF